MRRMLLPCFLLVAPLASASVALAAQTPGRLLSGPLPLAPEGGIEEHAFSLDGSHLLYVIDGELRSRGVGQPPVLLSLPDHVVSDFQLSAVGGLVVYYSPFWIYRVPVTGGVPQMVNPPLVSQGRVVEYQITPDGTHVVYRADAFENERYLLFSIPIGGGAPTEINGPMPPTGDVLSFQISPDATRVAYRTHTPHLYAAEIGVAGSGVQVNEPLDPGFIPTDVRISADSTRVVFRIDESSTELFSARIDGSGGQVQLSSAGPAFGAVQPGFAVSPTGNRIVYRADEDVLGRFELFSVPADGSAPPVRLHAPLSGASDVTHVAVSAAGGRAVYLADSDTDEVYELFSAPVDGSAGPAQLNSELAPGEDVLPDFLVGPQGTQVVFHIASSPHPRLLASAIDASSAPVELDVALASQGSHPTFGPDDQRIYYQKPVIGGLALASVPVHASTPPVVLGVGRTRVPSHRVAPTGLWVSYVADQDVRLVDELFVAPSAQSDLSVQISPEAPPSGVVGDVYACLAASMRALYVARQEDANYVGLYSVPLHGGPFRRISGDAPAVEVLPSGVLTLAAGARVVFQEGRQIGSSMLPGGLFSVPIDGSAAPVELNLELPQNHAVLDYVLSDDRTVVVYRGDQDADEVLELYRAPIDGSAPPVKLNAPLVPGGDVLAGYRILADGRVVYVADQDEDETFELFVADGVGTPLQLSGTLVPEGDVDAALQVAPEGARVFFRADAGTDGVLELFGVPSDGSAAPVALSGTLVPGGDVEGDFLLTPDGTRVVFRSDREEDERMGIYSVLADASAAPVRLDPNGNPMGDVTEGFLIDPGGVRALYRANALHNNRFDLFSVPLDGSALPTRLNRGTGFLGDVEPLHTVQLGAATNGFGIAPDGTTVVFLGREVEDVELWAVPIDGSSLRVRLNATLSPSNFPGIDSFYFDPTGEFVIYVGDREDPLLTKIFAVPLDLERPFTELTPPGFVDGIVRHDVSVAPDGSSVIFRFSSPYFVDEELYGARLRQTKSLPWPAPAKH